MAKNKRRNKNKSTRKTSGSRRGNRSGSRARKTRNTGKDVLTYPTIAAFIFDVPEPEAVDGTFNYNYFLPDEKISSNSRGTDASFKAHGNVYARTVKIEFTTLSDIATLGSDSPALELSDREKTKILEENEDKIFSELDFLGRNFSTITLQDTNATKKLQLAVEADLRLKKASTANLSPTESLLKFNSLTSDKVNGQDILKYTNIEGNNEYTYIDPSTGKPFATQRDSGISELSFACTFNNKFMSDILKRAESAPASPLFDSISSDLEEAAEIQAESLKDQDSNVVHYKDYEPEFEAVRVSRINTDSILVAGNQLLGYRIAKEEIDDMGSTKFVDNIFLTSPLISSYEDFEVVYGKTYRYSVSTVYLVRFYSFNGRAVVAGDVLVSSRESPFIDVQCTEIVPPAPPLNIKFWMTQNKKMCIEWDYPFNPQEDIKRFQIFRRKNLTEPFTLIKELDFDNSLEKTIRSENIPDYSILSLDKPRVYYEDYEFTLDTEYIYAICCVDAHDLSSSYSEQFSVKWNRSYAKLESKLISFAGAPKPYPNFNLIQTLTTDAIKDSRHYKLKIYFDPEYLKVTNNAEKDLSHLTAHASLPSYKLQLINLDRQNSKTVKINVIDER